MQFIENDAALCAHGNRTARRRLLEIADAAIAAVQPAQLVPQRLTHTGTQLRVGDTEYNLERIENLFVIGVGKGSLALVEAVIDELDTPIEDGIVVEKQGQGGAIETTAIEIMEAGHPVPNTDSLTAADRVQRVAERAGPDDLVLCCITGGASALLAAPAGELTIDDLATTTEQLLEAGVPIQALNAVRKHLSAIKGGRLALQCAPAAVASLIVVDEVAGDPWGPTVPDETTHEAALDVLTDYDLKEAIPTAVVDHLVDGVTGGYPETPDPTTFAELSMDATILADGTSVCEAAKHAAAERDFPAAILSTTIEGEASTVGTVHGGIAREIMIHGRPIEPPCVVISGGEMTVTVTGDGTGGPNQEFALGLAQAIDGLADITGLSIDTDGTDGPTPIAGGLVDGQTVERATDRGIDLQTKLRENDTMDALIGLEDAVRTTPTGTNLMDLRMLLIEG
ncbi:MAG: glycerate kinase [Halobacteriales archaeon]